MLQSGSVTKTYDYTAFGAENLPSPTDTNPFRYCSQYFDNETQSLYLRARQYDPYTGRFTSEDAYKGDLREPLTQNLYTYCTNDPVNYVDISGNSAILAVIAITVGSAAISAGISIISQLITNGGNWEAINWRSVGASAIAGVVTGAMAFMTAGLSLSINATIAAGAMIGANGYLTYNLANDTQPTLAGLLFAAEFGAVLSGVTYKIGHPSYGTQGARSVLDNANFAQKTYSQNFSKEGSKIYSDIAGAKITTVTDLADALKNGSINVADVQTQYIIRDGNTLILNTRTAQALIQAGIPRSQWNAVNVTGNIQFEQLLTDQLIRNNLTSTGISDVYPK